MKLAKGSGIELVTYALGSCIGVAIYDPEVKVGGLLHFMLPESKINIERSAQNPHMFCDTATPALFKAAYKMGAVKERLIVKIAGGSNVLSTSNFCDVGKRNHLAIRKILFANSIQIHGECVGGATGKTLRLNLTDGTASVKMPGGKEITI